MVETPGNVDSIRTLSAVIAADGPWTPDRALEFVDQAALQLIALHISGQIHGSLSDETLAIDANFRPTISSASQECGVGAVSLREWTHPELRTLQLVKLPTTIVAADELLKQHSVPLDPREIDVYQLNAVLCRLLTADSLDTYQRSPRAKGKVPSAIRPLLDRAGSKVPAERIRSMEELSAAIRTSLTQLRTEGHQAVEAAPPANGESQAVAPLNGGHDTSSILGPSQLLDDTSVVLHSGVNSGPREPQVSANDSPENLSSIIPSRERSKVSDELPFQKLGHYQVLDRIGCGGMGDVYRGYEQSLDRVVAIKVLPADLARQEEFVRRFRAEATAAARLIHPNIIQIFFIGEDSGHHFFAMQFVDGASLADLLAQREKLTVEETMGIMTQVLAGLAMAHKTGMVHRDIKPANILLDRIHNRALVADFGLVKSASNPGGKTATGVVMGTVDYIAPEQARAQSVDSRADLYSLGVLMYHMLTGKLPFVGDSPTAILFQHVYDVPKRVDAIEHDVPAPLASVVARLLEKSPQQRYQTAEDVLTDLRAFREGRSLPGLADAPVQTRAARQTDVLTLPWLEELRPIPDSLLASPAGGWWGRIRRNVLSMFQKQAPGLLAQLLSTQQQFDGAITQYERRRDVLQRLVNEAQSILTEFESQAAAYRTESAARRSSADRITTSDASPNSIESCTELDRIADELDQKAAEQREQLDAMSVNLAQVSATLHQLKSQRAILAARLATAEAQLKVAGGKRRNQRRRWWAIVSVAALLVLGIVALSLSPAAWERVTKSSSGLLYSVGLAKNPSPPAVIIIGDSRIKGRLVAAEFTQAPWYNNEYSYTLTCLFSDGTVRSSNVRRFDEKIPPSDSKTFTTHEQKPRALAVTPDGNTVAIGGEGNSIQIWSVSEKREVRRLQGAFKNVTAMRFSADGSKLLSAADPHVVCLWDVVAETELKRLNLRDLSSVADLDWSLDEHRFLVGSQTNGSRSLRLWSLDSDQEIQPFETPTTRQSSNTVALGPLPYALTHGGLKVHLWDVSAGKELKEFGDGTIAAAFSRDALSALTVDNDRIVKLWHARTGELIKTLGLSQDKTPRLAISPDGRYGVAISAAGELQSWTLPPPKPEGQITMIDSMAPVQSVTYSPDSVMVAFGSNTDLRVSTDPERFAEATSSHLEGPISCVSFSSDGRRLLYGTGRSNSKTNWMGSWSVHGGNFNQSRENRRYPVASDRIVAAVYHPDSSRVISASSDGAIVVWSAQGETELNRVELGVRINGMALLPSGSEMLVAVDHNDIQHWNLETRKEIRRLKGHTFHVSSVAVSEDGRFAVSGGKDRSVRTWDLATGESLKRLAGHTGYVNSAAISTDGQLVMSGSDDLTVRLWDAQSGEELRTFDGHMGPVRSVHLSPNGTRGVSGSDDGTVRIWDIRIPVTQDAHPDSDKTPVRSEGNTP